MSTTFFSSANWSGAFCGYSHSNIYVCIYTHIYIFKCLALETVSQSAAALIHIAFLHKSEKPELLLRKRALCWEPQPPSPHFLS